MPDECTHRRFFGVPGWWTVAVLFVGACSPVPPGSPAPTTTASLQLATVVVPSNTVVGSPSPATARTPTAGPRSPPPAAKPARVGIDIGDNFFSPKSVTVAAETTVIWQNRGGDEVQHNVVAEDSSFASGDVGPGNTFTHVFTTRGRFAYVCTYHVPQGMTAEIIVE